MLNYLNLKIMKVRFFPTKSETILYDKRFEKEFNFFNNSNYSCLCIRREEIYLIPLLRAVFLLIIKKIKRKDLKFYYNKFNLSFCKPKKVINLTDTDLTFVRLASFFESTKFILIQNSYRNNSFYFPYKLKKTDLLITNNPLQKYDVCVNQKYLGTFKYNNLKHLEKTDLFENNFIFINQYRDRYIIERFYNDFKFFYKNEKKLLPKLSELISDNYNKKLFFKSSYRNFISFSKNDEYDFFNKMSLLKISMSNNEIFHRYDENIYFSIDSTMVFELLSLKKKILVYPHRNIYNEHSHSEVWDLFKKELPEIVVSNDLSDLKSKIDNILNMSSKDYYKLISKFVPLKFLKSLN